MPTLLSEKSCEAVLKLGRDTEASSYIAMLSKVIFRQTFDNGLVMSFTAFKPMKMNADDRERTRQS